MNGEVRRRRRKVPSAPRSGWRSSHKGGIRPSARWVAKAAAVVVISLIAVVFIGRQFGADAVVSAPPDPSWPSDGTGQMLARADAMLSATPPDVSNAESLAKEALAESR